MTALIVPADSATPVPGASLSQQSWTVSPPALIASMLWPYVRRRKPALNMRTRVNVAPVAPGFSLTFDVPVEWMMQSVTVRFFAAGVPQLPP